MNTGGDTCHIGDGTSLSSSSNTAGDEAEGLTAYNPYHVLRGELCRELILDTEFLFGEYRIPTFIVASDQLIVSHTGRCASSDHAGGLSSIYFVNIRYLQ